MDLLDNLIHIIAQSRHQNPLRDRRKTAIAPSFAVSISLVAITQTAHSTMLMPPKISGMYLFFTACACRKATPKNTARTQRR